MAKATPKKAITKRAAKRKPEEERPEAEPQQEDERPAKPAKPAKAKAKKGRDAASKKSIRRKGHPKEVGDDDEERGEEFEEGPDAKRRPKSKANRLREGEEDVVRVPRGTIYIGNIPKGFYEPQMKTFFSQFGTVTRLRIARSKKTGGVKGYAFIEFEDEQVAEIVAKTMDKYIIAGKVMKVRLMDKSQIHPELFKNWNKAFKDQRPQRVAEFAAKYNDKTLTEVDGVMIPKLTKSQVISRARGDEKLANKLKNLGVSFDLDHLEGESEAGTALLAELQEKRKERKGKDAEERTATDLVKNKAGPEADSEGGKKKRRKRAAPEAVEAAGEVAPEQQAEEAPEAEAGAPAAAAGGEAAGGPKKAPLKKKKRKA